MTPLAALKGKARRRVMRLYRYVLRNGSAYAGAKPGYRVQIRDAERLSRAGLVTVATFSLASEPSEVNIFLNRADALEWYPKMYLLPGRVGGVLKGVR